ncbi:hypothetical protein D3C76_1313470 [compost metagenome]
MKMMSGCVTETVMTLPMDASSVNNKGTMAIMKLIMPVMASLAYPIATLKLLIAIMMMTI